MSAAADLRSKDVLGQLQKRSVFFSKSCEFFFSTLIVDVGVEGAPNRTWVLHNGQAWVGLVQHLHQPASGLPFSQVAAIANVNRLQHLHPPHSAASHTDHRSATEHLHQVELEVLAGPTAFLHALLDELSLQFGGR